MRSPTWRGYLEERVNRSLRRSTPAFRGVSAAALAAALPDAAEPAFVHLDAFAGNMLATGTTITAVIDIGLTSASGDARLDPVAARLGGSFFEPARQSKASYFRLRSPWGPALSGQEFSPNLPGTYR